MVEIKQKIKHSHRVYGYLSDLQNDFVVLHKISIPDLVRSAIDEMIAHHQDDMCLECLSDPNARIYDGELDRLKKNGENAGAGEV